MHVLFTLSNTMLFYLKDQNPEFLMQHFFHLTPTILRTALYMSENTVSTKYPLFTIDSCIDHVLCWHSAFLNAPDALLYRAFVVSPPPPTHPAPMFYFIPCRHFSYTILILYSTSPDNLHMYLVFE